MNLIMLPLENDIVTNLRVFIKLMVSQYGEVNCFQRCFTFPRFISVERKLLQGDRESRGFSTDPRFEARFRH